MFEPMITLNDLLRSSAFAEEHRSGIGWPNDTDPSQINIYSIKQIYQYAETARTYLATTGFQPITPQDSSVVGLFGFPANIEYVVTIFALMRLGYTIFVISPRMQASALGTLLEKTDCEFVFYSPTTSEIAHEVGEQRHIKLVPFLSLADLGETTSTDAETPDQDISENNKIALIWHSSGSTGLPKLFLIVRCWSGLDLATMPTRGSSSTHHCTLPQALLFYSPICIKQPLLSSGMKPCPIHQKT